ncbi:MAG: winged helix DNA-binding protein [Paracoccus sp. (in: a-proteobacteria)]|nr:winged helix DNA-binding protein [Paracoccus sp. (in: a-proteobacteria)]
MRETGDNVLPIAKISADMKGSLAASDLGPVVSSAHLAAGRSPALSEVEYGLMIASNAFNRWMVRCMAAAGYPGLSATEVAILHSIAHRDREKRMADIALILDIEDIHIVAYAMKKLEAAGLICTRRTGKEKLVRLTETGVSACQRYAQLREKLLLGMTAQTSVAEGDLSEAAALLRMLSGIYNQAARAAATF